MQDFFISYNKADKAYALAINCWLEDAGFTTVMQATDFQAGSNFVLEMHEAARGANRTIAILSPDYLASQFTAPEWAAAFATDPTGKLRKLVPVRIRECSLDGLIRTIVYIDLVGLDLAEAQKKLLLELSGKTSSPSPKKPAKKQATRKRPTAGGSSISQHDNGNNIYQSAGPMFVNHKPPINKIEFVREPHHISEAQAAAIKKKLDDLGERDEKAGKGATYGAWMNKFKATFQLTTYKALPEEHFEDAISWIGKQKGIQRPSLRRTNNGEWKKDHFKAIWGSAKKLGWSEDEVREAAQRYFKLKKPVKSLKDDLGEQKLEKFAGYMKRESRKKGGS